MATITAAVSMYTGSISELKRLDVTLNVVQRRFEALHNIADKVVDLITIRQGRKEFDALERAVNGVEERIRKTASQPVIKVEAVRQARKEIMNLRDAAERLDVQIRQTARRPVLNMESARQARRGLINVRDAAERLDVQIRQTARRPVLNMESARQARRGLLNVRDAAQRVDAQVRQTARRQVLNMQSVRQARRGLQNVEDTADRLGNSLRRISNRPILNLSQIRQSRRELDAVADASRRVGAGRGSASPAAAGGGRSGREGAANRWGQFKGMVDNVRSMELPQKVLNLSDRMANSKTRLNLLVDDGGSVDELQKKIMASAQRSRTAYLGTADAVSNLGVRAGDTFKNNDETIGFVEQVNKMTAIAGGGADQQADVMAQITDIMASGRVDGSDLDPILSAAPGIGEAVERYMGIEEGSLENEISKGTVTAGVLKNALLSMADETNAKFGEIPMTWEQLGTAFQNTMLETFEPLLAVVGQFAQFIVENWSTLEPIFWGLAAAVAFYAAASWIASGAARALFTALMGNPIIWIAVAVALLVALIYKWVQSVGGLRVAWMICVNAILTVWDQLKIAFFTGVFAVMNLFNRLQLTFMTVGVSIANFMGDMKASVLKILQEMINGAIDIINKFIDLLNKLPGVSIESIQKLTFGSEAEAKNEAEKTARNAALREYENEVDAKIKDRESQLNNMKIDAMIDKANRQAEIDMAKQEALRQKAEQETSIDIDSYNGNNLANSLNNGSSGGALDNINNNSGITAGNTAAMADSLEISQEDLTYLRDIAEREVVNRFTTAQLSVSMNTEATINNDMDIDGIISQLEDKTYETLIVAAEGV